MKADVTTLDAKKAGTIELSDDVYGLKPRADILHRMVRYQLAKRQAGTHHVNDRSEVTGTQKKNHKQKGTGSARRGNNKAPQLRGGGKAFGPKPRSHAVGLPKKVRALALKHALSAKVTANELIIIDNIDAGASKTKTLAAQFEKLGLTSALIIDGADVNDNFGKAASNLPNIDVLSSDGINVYDILRRKKLVLTKAAVEALEGRFK